MRGTAVEGSTGKKQRRSNRRNKQNAPSASEVKEIPGGSAECLGKNETPTPSTASLSNPLKQQQGANVCSPNERGLPRASNGTFDSMSTMHNMKENLEYLLQNVQFPSVPRTQTKGKYFSPHWSREAVEKALERGDVFKARFHVNAHNKLEAYCKIDGVPTDVLINGFLAQNRAVEGDIVAVKIDPLPLWTKMKVPIGNGNNITTLEGSNLAEDDEVGASNSKGKGKVGVDEFAYGRSPCQNKEGSDHSSTPYKSSPFPEKRCIYEDNTSQGSANHIDPLGLASHDGSDGTHSAASYSLGINSCSVQGEVINAVDKMCLLVKSFPSKRPTGRVIAVLEKSPRREGIVGRLDDVYCLCCKTDSRKIKMLCDAEYLQLTPIDPKFPSVIILIRDLPECLQKKWKSGDMTMAMDLVAVQIDDWSEERPFPEGHVLHTFGRGGEVQSQYDAILFQNAICLSEFSPEALSCLPCVPWELPLKEIQSRKDLRNLCVFTIDPATATDLDDALSIEKLPSGNYRVGVHIADVSYFVLPHTALDREAEVRSTSVYMSQRKLPMLPALFSENIGSLNPGVDRLAVSILLDITGAGDIVDRWVGRTVIQSCCKLSYEHAQYIINYDISDIDYADYPKVLGHFEWPNVITSLNSLYEISVVLKHKRFTDGALRLDNPKLAILFDENGIPYDTTFSERKESNFLVEEYMLLANITAAEVISRAYPDIALLRRHPEPNMRKLRELVAFCQKHGLEMDTSSSGQFHRSLVQTKEKLKDDPVLYYILISYATKPMQLASYFCSGDLKDKEHEWGHYALAVPSYTHFTSPLRRYPDIVVHRTLLAAIEAEELYMKHKKVLKVNKEVRMQKKSFTGINFDKNAVESMEGREALAAASLKHGVPCAKILADIATYCNERKLASRNVKDACDKLCMWFLLKKKAVLFSEARVLGLGPRFMSIYIQKLAIERRIYYDEVEGLIVDWLEATSTLVLSMNHSTKRVYRRGSPNKWRAFEEVALVTSPANQNDAIIMDDRVSSISRSDTSETEIEPAVFPLTVHVLSEIPVALHAVGGDHGPIDIGVRLYMSSYFGECGSVEAMATGNNNLM